MGCNSNNAELGAALLAAVRAQGFELISPPFPSIDLAVAAFTEQGPRFANVLFSREHPQGLVAEIGPEAGPVQNIRYVADQRDAGGVSIAWPPGADWDRIAWQPFTGAGEHRFVAPYPASLLKLMVLVGVASLVDEGRAAWSQPLVFAGRERCVGDWAWDMTVISCNESTSALVTLLHACNAIEELHVLFEQHGLTGLRLRGTQRDGGWGNAAGAGVGMIQMTAWDSLRLLWLLDPDAPAAPWLPADTPPLLGKSREHVLHCLRGQQLNDVLSSGSLSAELPGYVSGIPADLRFAHKTGNTENYCSDAGIVQGSGRHYLIAFTSSLGSRHATEGHPKTSWRVPALGAAVDLFVESLCNKNN